MADEGKWVIDLTEKDLSIEKIGGKALNLAKMSSAGFNIPPAFVVSVDAYDSFIKKGFEDEISAILDFVDFTSENSISDGCSQIRNIIKQEKLPQDLCVELNDKIENLSDGYYAVRSSAVAEDLDDASFAGQLDSFLNIKKENIPEKVVDCWASYWNDRAVKYRHDASIRHLDSKMSAAGLAVVLQKMVDADVSGVTFTTNPVDRSKNMVIESAWGLGEAIASGIVTPDIFVVDREGNVVEKNIKPKKKGYFLENGENTLITINEENMGKPTLNHELLKKLLKMGVELEELFGVAQDIEWALEYETDGLNNRKPSQNHETTSPTIYILQSRPVTTLTDSSNQDDILWTRAYGDEYWADATTPLFYDVMGKMLTDYVNHEGARIMGYTEITDTKLLKLHKSRVYFNTWVLEKAFSYYPKFARSQELLNYFPLEDQQRISQYPSILHKTLLSQILIAIRDPDGMMHRTDKVYRKWAKGFMEKCSEFDNTDLTVLSDREILSLYHDIENAGIKHYQLIRYGMVSHSIATNLMIKNWLIKWLDDEDGSLYAGLISGLDDNKTVTMNIRFSDLAKTLREDDRLLDKINSMDDLNSLNEVEIDTLLSSNSDFNKDFHQFIADYGHRSNTREILYPRWKENKSYVLGVVKLLSSSDLDLGEKELESRENRFKTEKEVLGRIKKQNGGFFKAKLFKIVLNLAQTYLTFRENQRFYLDHLLFRQRLMLLDMGRRLLEKGIIDEVNDVFFIYERELMSFFETNPSLKELDEKIASNDTSELKDEISLRKTEFYRYESSLPPKFLKNGIEFDDTVMEFDESAVHGAAASPGTFNGIARVVESIEELSQLEDNEILITSNTDPAWTAVFSKVGGLITETGGILSHGAVISREYRIPAVTAVKGATTIFKTGEELVVDGNDGVVYKKVRNED
ncbi:PEP/pyruvate-binding domain-containing protein [Methanobacterium petrolearium]|uniref:PEP/pyruvate-binding domain-containing protein n=2 Tax=Methanobacterium petrolearium TaxID=710190 RepID=UPI001FD80776|nr:PEP/pyruvate-binding domain-containing protein [Methanobacterium petrolearium]MBP1946692.1 pyruvate,water dikinase [Methanobacterium petrolearium]